MSASSVVRATILLLHGSQISVMIQRLLIDKEAGFNGEQNNYLITFLENIF